MPSLLSGLSGTAAVEGVRAGNQMALGTAILLDVSREERIAAKVIRVTAVGVLGAAPDRRVQGAGVAGHELGRRDGQDGLGCEGREDDGDGLHGVESVAGGIFDSASWKGKI